MSNNPIKMMREIATSEKGFNAYLFFYMIILSISFVASFTNKITTNQFLLININLCGFLTLTIFLFKIIGLLLRKKSAEAGGMMFAFYDYYQKITPLISQISFRDFMTKLNGDKEYRDNFFRDFHKHYKFEKSEIFEKV